MNSSSESMVVSGGVLRAVLEEFTVAALATSLVCFLVRVEDSSDSIAFLFRV